MASIATEPNGRRRVLFRDVDGVRRTLRLGKTSQRNAEAVRTHVESIVAARTSGASPPPETEAWLAGRPAAFLARLARVGLAAVVRDPTIDGFIREYIDSRSDVTAATRITLENVKRNLLAHFGRERRLRDVSPGDADGWRLWLRTTEKLADNTVRRRTGIARQFWRAAVRSGLIASNPWDGLAAAVRVNVNKFRFVTVAESQAILDACPSIEWRLIFALSRYGGMRCPSEVLALRWEDVDWEHSRLHVRSPKTARHAGGEARMVPMFPELRPLLQSAFDEAPEGAVRVVGRAGASEVNLRTHMERIIRRAGVKPWPKLFQNLRSTRETELVDRYPIHAVCAWIGNSEPVAKKHYLQVTDAHFAEAAQNPALQAHAGDRMGSHGIPVDVDCVGMHGGAGACGGVPGAELGGTGLEPADALGELSQASQSAGADSGAPIADTQLAELMRLWPGLGADARLRVLAAVRAWAGAAPAGQ